jgi:hypothetical protein
VSRELEAALLEKNEILRPGFTRLSLSCFMADEEVGAHKDILPNKIVVEHPHRHEHVHQSTIRKCIPIALLFAHISD